MWEKEKWPATVPNVTTTSCQTAEAAEAGKLCEPLSITLVRNYWGDMRALYYSGSSFMAEPEWLGPQYTY
jgi:hypothetical protein